MLNVITPGRRDQYKDLLKGIKKDPEGDTTYFVFIDDRFGMIGWAELKPLFQNGCVCSNILFSLPKSACINKDQAAIAALSGRFFHDLYEALYSTAKEQSISRLLIMAEFELIKSLWHIGWPIDLSTVNSDHDDNDHIQLEVDIETQAIDTFRLNRQCFEMNLLREVLAS